MKLSLRVQIRILSAKEKTPCVDKIRLRRFREAVCDKITVEPAACAFHSTFAAWKHEQIFSSAGRLSRPLQKQVEYVDILSRSRITSSVIS